MKKWKNNSWICLLLLVCVNSWSTPLSTIVGNDTKPTIIGDKQGGVLYVYIPTRHLLLHTPALYGKTKSDSYRSDKNERITPSGEFVGQKYFSSYLQSPIIVFQEGKTLLAIHSVWLGQPIQGRMYRLSTESPLDNRITNGCINVYPEFYHNVLDSLPNTVRVHILSEHESLIDDLTKGP